MEQTAEQITPAGLGRRLVRWFAAAQRPLPWRETQDPYAIWLSEVMLQQTRVETVIPYYHRFLQRFPTLEALAEAPLDEVLKLWEGLGYYSRARNLHRAAQEAVLRWGGRVPEDPEAFAALPGVGPYTLGAVMSIAFGRPIPAIDGNAVRVLARVLAAEEDVTRPAGRRLLEQAAREMMPEESPGQFNQALMELGATVCTPRSPQCGSCPLEAGCAGRASGDPRRFPVKPRRTEPREVPVAVAVVEDGAGRLLLVKRPARGLLAGLWEFPTMEVAPGETAEEAVRRAVAERGDEALAAWLVVGEELFAGEHLFSHRLWRMRAYRCRVEVEEGRSSGGAGAAGAVPPPLEGAVSEAAASEVPVPRSPAVAVAEEAPPWDAGAQPPLDRGGRSALWVRPEELGKLTLSSAHRKVAWAVFQAARR